jgi:hypothetical protein
MGDGSFVKANKVTSGRFLIDALRERYVGYDAPATVGEDSVIPDAYVITSKGHQKSIEFVGEIKIRKWQQIEDAYKIAIRNDTVSAIGSDIAEAASFITEMDLQDNLLWEWKEVANLSSQLPGLNVLLLHGNKMQQISREIVESFSSESLRGLKVLALNSCDIKSWNSIQLLEPFLTSIEELYLALNDFSELPRTDNDSEMKLVSGFSTLRLLDLSECRICSWYQILAFQKISNLQELILDSNPIPNIMPRSTPMMDFASSGPSENVFNINDKKDIELDIIFPCLQRLSLSSTGISSYMDIIALSTYETCTILRLSQIPLFIGIYTCMFIYEYVHMYMY